MTSKFNFRIVFIFILALVFMIQLSLILFGDSGLNPNMSIWASSIFKLFFSTVCVLIWYSILNQLVIIKTIDNTSIHLRNIITKKEDTFKHDDIKSFKYSSISEIITIKTIDKTYRLYAVYYKNNYELIKSLQNVVENKL